MTAADDMLIPPVNIEGTAVGNGRVFQVAHGSLNDDYSMHYRGPSVEQQQTAATSIKRDSGWEYLLYAATLNLKTDLLHSRASGSNKDTATQSGQRATPRVLRQLSTCHG